MTARTRNVTTVLVSLVLLTSACGRFSRSGTPLPTLSPIDYGADLEFTPPPQPGEGTGRLTIFVAEDGTNFPIEGAIVRFRGDEQSGQMITDETGRASRKVPTGFYTVDLPPCGDTAIITKAAEADVSVVRDTESGGPLFTTWEPRFRPTPSVRSDPAPPWPVGTTIQLAVRLEDACDFSEAEKQRAHHFAWTAEGPFAFVGQPGLTAGDDGRIPIEIQCTSSGDGSVVIFNTRDPSQEVDLITSISAPADGRSYCE